MKKDYIKKRKKMPRKVVTTIVVVAAVLVFVAFIGKYFAVDFIFDNYIIKPALEVVKDGGIAEIMKQGEETAEENETSDTTAAAEPDNQTSAETKNDNKTQNANDGNNPKTEAPAVPASPAKTSSELSTAEIAYKVLASPELMAKLEGMVSSSDKSAVISIAKSCFTNEEKKYYLAEIAKKGLTPQIKSEMMGIVRSRMTGAKKSSVLSLFSKYAEALRPYVK